MNTLSRTLHRQGHEGKSVEWERFKNSKFCAFDIYAHVVNFGGNVGSYQNVFKALKRDIQNLA